MAYPLPPRLNNLSPTQKPILKKSFLNDSDISPLSVNLNRRQVSVQNSYLDTTLQTSFVLPTEQSIIKDKDNKDVVVPNIPTRERRGVTIHRAFASTIQNMPPVRRRAVSTISKVVSSTNPDQQQQHPQNHHLSFLDTSVESGNNNNNKSALEMSFQFKRRSVSKKESLPPMSGTPFNQSPRLRSISIAKSSQTRTRSQTKDSSADRKIKLQSFNEGGENVIKKREFKNVGLKRILKEEGIVYKLLGSSDPVRKERFAKVLEHSLRRILKMTEAKVKDKNGEIIEKIDKKKNNNNNVSLLEKLRSDSSRSGKPPRPEKLSDKDAQSESMDEVRELQSDGNKEDKKKEVAEFVFYREINEMINFCVRENSINIFLKCIKLLGNLYFHYEKLDEAFHCFVQLRWASEYLGEYKFKAKAFAKMAECCKAVGNYDEAIKLLRKSLQYSWEYNLVNQEMKVYDTLGKLYYLKGEIKKAFYYNHRFSSGGAEPIESPLREIYNMFLKDNKERGKYGYFSSLDPSLMLRISLPYLPGDNMRRNSSISSFSSLSFDDHKKQEFEKRPANVKGYQDQLNIMMEDSEILVQKKKKVASFDNNNEEQQQQMDQDDIKEKENAANEPTELPSPTFKTNFAEFDPERSQEQRLRDLKVKEERINEIIKNAKKDLLSITGEDDRKRRKNNIVQLHLAFQREKKLIVYHQQDYRIHMAKLWKHQYHVFEDTTKEAVCKVNIKTDSNIVRENKFDMNLEDPDYFQGVKRKVLAQRFENNLPPFILMTHKKMQPKPLKKDKGLFNEGAKKIYMKFYKKLMRKIAPERVNKFATRQETVL